MNSKISHLKWLQRTTPDGWVDKHPHSVIEYCFPLLPFLVVHHHLTQVILIGIIFISQILQWSLVIGRLITLNNKMNNYSLGSRTSMVLEPNHQ